MTRPARIKVKWIAGALALALAALAALPAVREPLARKLGLRRASTLQCEPSQGMSASYTLGMHTSMQVNAAALLLGRHATGRSVGSELGLSARLRIKAVEPRGKGMLLGIALDELEADGGEELGAHVREQLTTPLYAVLERDCSFSQFGFASGVEDDVVNRLQGLLQGLSVSLREARTWTSQEYDAVGRYSARYERDAGAARAFDKHRETYVRAHASAGFGLNEPLQVRVLESDVPGALDEDFAWLERLDSREHLQVLRNKGAVIANLHTTLSLERRHHDASELTLTRSSSEMRWRKTSAAPLVAAARLPEPPDALKTLPLTAAMTEYERLMRSGQPSAAMKAAEFLALYLRAQPPMAAELIALIADNAIAPDLESTVFLGLERANTPEARAALITALSDDFAARQRARAAAALPDIQHPGPETLTALHKTAQTAVAETPDETRLVRNAAGYAIGTLERRTRDSDPALAEAARSELRSSLASARDVQQRAAALDAIANSGHAELLRDVQPLMASEEGLVRTHAIEAMAHMEPDANKALFGTLIESEPDPRIRGTIAATYAEQARATQQASPKEVVDSAIQQLGREPDPHVKGLLIELIGPACATYASAEQSLGKQFQNETDPALLKLIGKYVPADHLGR